MTHLSFLSGYNEWNVETCKSGCFFLDADIQSRPLPDVQNMSELLRLCKIWGLYGGDYEEFPPLEYRKPVSTSQETHYVSATEISRLMLCEIWGFNGGDWRILSSGMLRQMTAFC
jgi:hypothetical protein